VSLLYGGAKMSVDTRKKMLERVKAILAKTMDNGCTEGSAMAGHRAGADARFDKPVSQGGMKLLK
jgi:dihydroxyacetone kinase DhaKLM complex PTS-EIIA-like component DhaM